MKRKKTEVTETVSPAAQRVIKTKTKESSDILEIKRKMAKVNLYLSLLNKQLFETVPVADVDIATEIENEVNEFLINKAKSVFAFSNSVNPLGFNESELAFLKLLSKKGTTPKTEVKIEVPEVKIEPEPAVLTPVEKVIAKQTKPVNKSNVIRKTVSVIGQDGKPQEVEIETEKVVHPPANIRRLPAASYEEQLARAHSDMAAMQRAVQTTGGPLVVDSTHSVEPDKF